MKEALGVVETRGLANTILVADTMVKTANVELIDIENTKGLGFMTIKVLGDVGAINAAVNSGKKIAIENNAFVSAKVIPRPSDYVENTFCQLKKEDISSSGENNNVIKEEIKANDILKPILKKSFEDIDNTKVENNDTVEYSQKVDEKINVENNYENEEFNTEVEEVNVEVEENNIETEESNIENSQLVEKKAKKSSRKKKDVKKDNN